jgi:ribosomal protein L9
LYGSIKPKEISLAILNEFKVEVKPSQIVLKEDLNKIGIYKIDINFHSEVSAQISIKIDKIQSA